MIPIKCKWCGYEWETRSQIIWVTCPNCQGKTPHPEHYKGEEEVDYRLVREDISQKTTHGSMYDPIIDDFLEMNTKQVKVEVKDKEPKYVRVQLYRRLKDRSLLDRAKPSIIGGKCYLERLEDEPV